LWLDAADASTVTTVSGAVSQWNDKSGNGRHATQSTTSRRPLVTPSALNGKQGITFDGVDDFLAFSASILNATHSLFVLFQPTLENVIGSVFGQWAAGQAGRYLWSANQGCSGSATSGRLNIFNASTTEGSCTGALGLALDVAIPSAPVLIGSLSTTGSEQWKLFKDGSQWESATISSLYTGVNSSLGSVNAGDPTNPFDGVILEVVSLNSYADATTRQKLEGYLAHKWGLTANLPAGHPYKTVGPTP